MIGLTLVSGVSGSGRPPPDPLPDGERSEPAAAPGQSGRVLIVEDDYLVALSSEWALTDAGFEVVAIAATGEEAVVAALEVRPDLLLMDIRLAGDMDGIDTALALRAHGLRCLFASANSDPATVARGAAAEPLGWLRKPFTDTALVAAVSEALIRLGARNDRE